MRLTLKEVKKNAKISNFLSQTEIYLDAMGFTDHGLRHVGIVSGRSQELALKIGLNKRDQELVAIAGWCHDMGNFLGRTDHHYLAATLFAQVYLEKTSNVNEVSRIMQAIASHDKDELKLVDDISAVLIIADKSDVHRSRVKHYKSRDKLGENDIHDRVNYASTYNQLLISKSKKEIVLRVKIDTKVAKPMEYFEIFNDRMIFCETAAKYLGYNFVLIINNFKLS
ncbi:MAG: HD domain-containing protein [Patescibacteria group bacterium]|jgi:hypothetical protein